MAIQSYTAGYGPQCTMSDNGAGKVRVTFPAWDFDWELYNDMAVDGSHYLYNQSTAVSGAITAKGGTESGGYYFDIGGTAFPSANWNNTDRCVPTFQAAANDYNSIALANAAMSALDIRIDWYNSTACQSSLWTTPTTIPISIYGGLSRQRVCYYLQNSSVLYLSGDKSAMTSQVTARNGTAYAGNFLTYEPNSGQAGAGVIVSRCIALGPCSFLARLGRYAAASIIKNCIAIGANCMIMAYTSEAAHIYEFCTAYDCLYGISCAYAGQTIKNCLLFTSSYGVYSGAAASITYCASNDATLGEGTGNIQNQTRANLAMWVDSNSGCKWPNPRILSTSACYHTGRAVDGITTDIDGNTRMNPPSIGAHEGTSQAYPVPAGTISGTFTATLHASQNKVTLDLTGLTQTGGIYWVICVRQGSTPVGSEDAYKLYHIPIATTSFDIMQNYDGAQASHASLLYITVQIESAAGVRTALGTAVSVTPHGYLEVND